MQEIMNEIGKLQKKAALYDNLMARSTEFTEKLEQAAELLKEVAEELAPTANRTRELSGINYHELAAEIYEKMQAGTEVGTDMLQNLYPEWKYHQIQSLVQQITAFPNVDSRKEGRKIFYYCKKEMR